MGIVIGVGVEGDVGTDGHALLGEVVGEGAVGAKLRALVGEVVGEGDQCVYTLQHTLPV